MAAQTNASPQTPWLFAPGPYMSLREWFDSEDVIAGISLPMIQMLTGRSPRFRDFLMGFLNQIIARNAVALTGGGMNPVTLHSVKSLLAGALVPLEDYLWRKKSVQSEGFFRSMSKATVASLIAGAGGSIIGDTLPGYL